MEVASTVDSVSVTKTMHVIYVATSMYHHFILHNFLCFFWSILAEGQCSNWTAIVHSNVFAWVNRTVYKSDCCTRFIVISPLSWVIAFSALAYLFDVYPGHYVFVSVTLCFYKLHLRIKTIQHLNFIVSYYFFRRIIRFRYFSTFHLISAVFDYRNTQQK